MDRQIWKLMVNAIRSADRSVPRSGRRPIYSDCMICKMLLWANGHDRPLCWACDREHYTTVFRPRRLPSVSQFCRRVKTPRLQAMLVRINNQLNRRDDIDELIMIDGKPLPLSNQTTDPDARRGYADRTFRNGYRMHAAVADDGRILGQIVRPMNVSEAPTARDYLTKYVPEESLVLADANYDSRPLYEAVAERGGQLLTRLKGKMARSDSRLNRMPQSRLNAWRMWDHDPRTCEWFMHLRDGIERAFGTLCSFGGGLQGLPSWVRRLDRVQRWVTGKVILYNARLRAKL